MASRRPVSTVRLNESPREAARREDGAADLCSCPLPCPGCLPFLRGGGGGRSCPDRSGLLVCTRIKQERQRLIRARRSDAAPSRCKLGRERRAFSCVSPARMSAVGDNPLGSTGLGLGLWLGFRSLVQASVSGLGVCLWVEV